MPYSIVTADSDELAHQLANEAITYFLAAKQLAPTDTNYREYGFRGPRNFLLAHCCELALSSMLVAVGVTQAKIQKEIKHDLMAALAEADVWGVKIEYDFRKYCQIMAEPHLTHAWRYPGRSSPPWISTGAALLMVEPQLAQLRATISTSETW